MESNLMRDADERILIEGKLKSIRVGGLERATDMSLSLRLGVPNTYDFSSTWKHAIDIEKRTLNLNNCSFHFESLGFLLLVPPGNKPSIEDSIQRSFLVHIPYKGLRDGLALIEARFTPRGHKPGYNICVEDTWRAYEAFSLKLSNVHVL